MKNKYKISDDAIEIEIVSRKYGKFIALLDICFLGELKEISTIGLKMSHTGKPYARCEYKGKRDFLHRHIMDYYGSLQIDHINGNGLDNRRSNLRIGTAGQNQQNIDNYNYKSKSGIRGLVWHTAAQKWQVSLNKNGKTVYKKFFKDKDEALENLEKARKEYHEWTPKTR